MVLFFFIAELDCMEAAEIADDNLYWVNGIMCGGGARKRCKVHVLGEGAACT